MPHVAVVSRPVGLSKCLCDALSHQCGVRKAAGNPGSLRTEVDIFIFFFLSFSL